MASTIIKIEICIKDEDYSMENLLITIAAAFLGGFLLQKLRVPGGMMLGSVLTVALLNINTSLVDIPPEFRFLAQCIAGAYIGMTVKRENFGRLKDLVRPILVLLGGLFATNVLVGILIYLVSPLDLLTSFLCGIPGGISDTPLIAADLGADATKVTVLQFVRLISGIGMIPLLVKREKGRGASQPSGRQDLIEKKEPPFGTPKLWISLAVAILGGLLGKNLGIPAGTLLFAMISILLLKMLHVEVTFPIWFKRLAQLFSGAYIGSHFGYQDFLELKFLLIPALILVGFNLLACYLLGHYISVKFAIPLSQAILSSSPAGASDMALIASDLGVSGSDVAMIQIARLIGAISIFPQIFYFVSQWFS